MKSWNEYQKPMVNYALNPFMTEADIIRNQSIDLQRKSMDWFLYDIDLRHERVK